GPVPRPHGGRGDGHSSRAPVARHLLRPTRAAHLETRLADCGRRAAPIRSCSRWGLPCQPCYQDRGALLPHPFTLAPKFRGGLLSLAISLGCPPPHSLQ